MMTPSALATHPLLAAMANDPAYLASRGIHGGIADPRTEEQKALSAKRTAALLALAATPSDDLDAAAGWL